MRQPERSDYACEGDESFSHEDRRDRQGQGKTGKGGKGKSQPQESRKKGRRRHQYQDPRLERKGEVKGADCVYPPIGNARGRRPAAVARLACLGETGEASDT